MKDKKLAAFLKWISEDVNPQRERSNMKAITTDDVKRVYYLLTEFDKARNTRTEYHMK